MAGGKEVALLAASKGGLAPTAVERPKNKATPMYPDHQSGYSSSEFDANKIPTHPLSEGSSCNPDCGAYLRKWLYSTKTSSIHGGSVSANL